MTEDTIPKKEEKILDYWDSDNTFKKSLEQTKKGKEYVFYDGPPFATGLPHYGHLLASIIKDTIPRFWTMKGKHVRRVWGWDCHGLPIENIAEQQLGINSKEEIEKMGIQKFNQYCREAVLKYAQEWKGTIRRIARWVDFDNSYKTMDNNYIESVWWAFKELYNKGYVYKGEKILMYCPRCATPLSKSEITMDNSYKTIKDLSVTVKFELEEEPNTYALAWTTTPWTLPSNLALSVHPELEYAYAKDKRDGNTYLLAKELLNKYYKNEEEYEITKTVTGKELEGKTYKPLFGYFKEEKNAFRILNAEYVTAEDGTGIVHTAPAFGEEDYNTCKKNGIEMVQPVDEKGRFTKEVKDYEGKLVHDTNEDIVITLKKQGKAIHSQKIEHEYPYCYRCNTKLLYRALPAWFINIQNIKTKLLEHNNKIHWHPEHLQQGRVKHNIENAPDWNISRNRYWASALPIWEAEDGDRIIIGSKKELQEHATTTLENIDLHKDYLDDIILEKQGKQYKRVKEVFDCWFESGSMPFAQFHYPFENKEYFEQHFPAQYVAEYIAQTRTWFYYTIALSTILFDNIPFEHIHTTGTILAEDGEKMSKSKGNFPDPKEIINKYGADALRYYLLNSPVMNADDTNFSDKQVEEAYRKVLLLLYNIKNFYELYKEQPETKEKPTHILDKWILSRIQHTTKTIEEQLTNYNTVKATEELRTFIEDLSTWYVRNTRERFNNKDTQAKTTLKKVLQQLSTTTAPLLPFIAEELHQTINNNKTSVHLEPWPTIKEEEHNEELEQQMEVTRTIVSHILRERDKQGIGIRWPLQEATIHSPLEVNEELQDIIQQEVNIKELHFHQKEQVQITLNTEITPELEAEGYTRELTRKIQALRKKAGLQKEEQITLSITGKLTKMIQQHEEYLKEKVGATNISYEQENYNHSEEGKIKDKEYHIQLQKA